MAMFHGASSFVINDGNFITGNHVYIIQRGPAVILNRPIRTIAPNHHDAKSLTDTNTISVASSNERNTSSAKPNVMVMMESAFQFLEQLIEPHSGGIFRNLHTDLRDLKTVVNFSYQAHQACGSLSHIGPIIQQHIESRMACCARTLVRLHGQIHNLPHRWVPIWQLPGSLLHSWWNKNQEPEDIVSIRLEIAMEVEEFGRSLSCLKSIHWMQQLLAPLRSGNISLTSQEIRDFFASGPPSLRHVVVEEIIVIEPLGKPLAIPLRFVDSLEQVHFYVQLGCKGTRGSRYIDSNRYQLDNSITNEPVDASVFRSLLKPGNVFEVSILIECSSLGVSECPRCGHINDQRDTKETNGWVECGSCRKFFNVTEVTRPQESLEDVHLGLLGDIPPTYSPTSQTTGSSDAESDVNGSWLHHIPVHLGTFILPSKRRGTKPLDTTVNEDLDMGDDRFLFRRLKAEVLLPLRVPPIPESNGDKAEGENNLEVGTIDEAEVVDRSNQQSFGQNSPTGHELIETPWTWGAEQVPPAPTQTQFPYRPWCPTYS